MFLVGLGVVAPFVGLVILGALAMNDLSRRLLDERSAMAVGLAGQLEHDLVDSLAALDAAARGVADPRCVAAGSAIPIPGSVRRGSLVRTVFRVAGALPGSVWAGLAERPEAEVARRTGRPQFVCVQADAGRDPSVVAVLAVRDATGRPCDLVAGILDTAGSAWSARVRSCMSQEHPGKKASIIDTDGHVLAGVRAPGILDLAPVAARVVSREAGVDRVVRPDGVVERIAIAPLRTAPWFVVIREPESDLMGGWGRWAGRIAVLAATALALALLFAWGVARSVTLPIDRLRIAAGRIAEGRLEEPVPDLGSDEVGELGRAFEAMRVALDDSLRKIRRHGEETERKVEEATRELRKLYKELEARDHSRRQLLQKVIRAQEDERRRIARELHDEACQTLVALRIALDGALAAPFPAESEPAIRKARDLAARTLEEVHRLMIDLRPSALDDLGLVAAIKSYASKTLEPLGVAVRYELEPLPGDLPGGMPTALFRATQEAVNNVARHAMADNVLVQTGYEDGRIRIEVEDDGRGFEPDEIMDPSDQGRGLGILGMRERIEIFGGTVTVDSAPGRGTHVTLSVPVTASGAA
jgi:signal transduction histidine kinase